MSHGKCIRAAPRLELASNTWLWVGAEQVPSGVSPQDPLCLASMMRPRSRITSTAGPSGSPGNAPLDANTLEGSLPGPRRCRPTRTRAVILPRSPGVLANPPPKTIRSTPSSSLIYLPPHSAVQRRRISLSPARRSVATSLLEAPAARACRAASERPRRGPLVGCLRAFAPPECRCVP